MRENEREKTAENDGGESKMEEREEEREKEGEQTEEEAMKAVFQQAIEIQTASKFLSLLDVSIDTLKQLEVGRDQHLQ